ncbi:MAG: extracellular solute-binding protein, partial [Oscillospiraceae bacterium]|nr:extracellular solute-binding protein [Oscillospiraceae bacterium]
DRDAYTAAAEHLLYPVDKLPYVDLSRPYWCQLPNRQLTVAGRLYWGFSDDMLSFFEATILTYFNKRQVLELGLEDLYDLVRSGNWTQDKFYEFARAAIRDLDGDGRMTEADNWGLASDNDYIYYSFWSGAGVITVDKDENDIPYFSVPGNQKLFDIASRVISEFKTEGLALDSARVPLTSYGGMADGSSDARISFFRSGHSLFSIGAIPEMVQLRDMPDDFGVLPLPKYNSDQEQYYSRVIGGFPFVIPTTNPKPEIAGVVMEVMACSARNEIIPAYYESALKTKYSRDADTAEMLDLIFDTRMYDLGDTIWCMTIRNDYANIFARGEDNFSSFTESKRNSYETAIEKAVAGILENEN